MVKGVEAKEGVKAVGGKTLSMYAQKSKYQNGVAFNRHRTHHSRCGQDDPRRCKYSCFEKLKKDTPHRDSGMSGGTMKGSVQILVYITGNPEKIAGGDPLCLCIPDEMKNSKRCWA